MSSSSDQWMQFYNQSNINEDQLHVDSSIAFSDARVITASAGAVASESILSPSRSCSIGSQLTPKGCVSKPVRRRSRASKKEPTTLLNANTNNFRALVQQFTGCPSRSFSSGSKKVPVNLNFGLGNQQNDQIRYAATSVAANFGNNYFCDNYQQSHHQLQPPQQQQQLSQEQQCLASFDHVGNDAIMATASNYCNPNGFAMDNDMFHEHSSEVFYS